MALVERGEWLARQGGPAEARRLGAGSGVSFCCAAGSRSRSGSMRQCPRPAPALLRRGQGNRELWEYSALVTSLDDEILTLGQLYRDRADCENAFDELKNQWGWGGFTTHDIARCQLAARNVALIYNWWSLFVRLADQASTSRRSPAGHCCSPASERSCVMHVRQHFGSPARMAGRAGRRPRLPRSPNSLQH